MPPGTLDDENAVQVILQSIPTQAGATGILYPASMVPEWDSTPFASAHRVCASQPAIFDSDGHPVLPSHVPSILTVGTAVRVVLSFGARKPNPDAKLEVYILSPQDAAKDENADDNCEVTSTGPTAANAMGSEPYIGEDIASDALSNTNPTSEADRQTVETEIAAHASTPTPTTILGPSTIEVKHEPEGKVNSGDGLTESHARKLKGKGSRLILNLKEWRLWNYPTTQLAS
ncbi:SubName: Full=Uncharacterized protein {ECO:0000313/EMBL:CCA74826.1} [Serendipita indica DSM 11827]|nr:SubName: Full=Uncharacterized protein {ECO:0000313/EMBL:CCA74826.1} [Serendipita indica DSM 11827]